MLGRIDAGGEAAVGTRIVRPAAVDRACPRRSARSSSQASTAPTPAPALWDGGRVRLEDLVRLRRARDLVDRDYAKPLDVPALARTAFLSPGHFSRSFRAAFGETPYSYLMTRRIERAKGLLRRGDLTVTEVCFAVGCTSLGSFSSRFTDWSARAKAPPGPAAMTRAPPSRPAWLTSWCAIEGH